MSVERDVPMKHLACLAGLVLAMAMPAHAADPVSLQPVLGWGGHYRPSRWTPVTINLTSNLSQPVEAVLSVTASQDSLTRLAINHPLVLLPGATRDVPLVTHLAAAADDLVVAVSAGNKSLYRRQYELVGGGYEGAIPANPVSEQDMLIGLIGTARYGLGQVVGRLSTRSGQVFLGQKNAGGAPFDWTGYESLDVLLLVRPDWGRFHREQIQALADWLSGGGRLVIFGGDAVPPDSPLGPLLPARRSPPSQGRQVEAIGQARWPKDVGPEPLAAYTYEVSPESGWKTLARTSAGSVVVAGPAGFGRAVLVGVNPDDLAGEDVDAHARFWQWMLAESEGEREVFYRQDDAQPDTPTFGRHMEIDRQTRSANEVLEYLLTIPQLRPLSIWVVVGLLLAMTVAVGPVNYLVLKRLGKLPWTWRTTLACIVVFSALAYYGVQWLRGGEGRVRVVTISDHIAGTDVGWQTSYTGIFAPVDDNYRLRGVGPRQWWSAIAPQEEYYYYDRMDRATRYLGCAQVDGGNVPHSMPINIWSMQSYLSRGPAGAAPVQVEWEPVGEQWQVTVTNESDLPIRWARLRISHKESIVLVNIAPGQSATRTARPRPVPAVSEMRYLADRESGSSYTNIELDHRDLQQARGVSDRTDGLHRWLSLGRPVMDVEFDTTGAERAGVEYEVAARRCAYDHVRLARIVLPPVSKETDE